MAADRGKDIAVPLKQALAETKGITVVRAVPRTGASALKLGYRGAGMRGEAFVRGETIFVGFEIPTFDPKEMNKKIEELLIKFQKEKLPLLSLLPSPWVFTLEVFHSLKNCLQ